MVLQDQIQGFRLSPQQQRLWLFQQDSTAYRAQCAILLEGNLNIEILKTALQTMCDRHEIFRTSFHRPPGIKLPLQAIASDSVLEVQMIELNQEAIEAYCDQPLLQINWEQSPLIQTTLVQLSLERHFLLIGLPAVCADAPTLHNLLHELCRCYAAQLQGEILEDEPLQYADLANWQHDLLADEQTQAGREYWQKLDLSDLEKLQLPFTRCAVSDFAPQVFTQTICSDLSKKIAAIATDDQTSVSTLLLTCWQILLGRMTEQANVIVGMASDGRNYEELKATLGLLVKYLPLACQLKDHERFCDCLARVEESVGNAIARQEYFTWKQLEATAFFPFCFEFETRPDKYVVGDVCFSIYQQYTCVDRFGVKLACVAQGDTLTAEFHYDSNLFAAEDIQRLAGQFATLLTDAVEHPEKKIAELDILSPIERQQLIVNFNHTKTKALPYLCVHHWFETQVKQTPDNIAVVCQNQQLTYRELNEKANQLAHYLRQQGVKPEVIVALCVERSLAMVVGVLGIQKAGGAYLPLDPAYPKQRLEFILEDTQASILLTQQKLQEILPEQTALVLCLDSDWEKIAAESTENPVSELSTDNLAYVIYTSGSTGKPKGTLIPHRGLVNYLNWCTQAYAVEQGVGAIVHSSLAFDLTITGLFSPLLTGRQVELLPDELSIETLSLALSNSSNLSLVKLTPAQLRLLSQQLPPSAAVGRTRSFIIGGENLLAEDLAFWQQFAPETKLVNEYGPTETVVGCCVYQVPLTAQLINSVPIGQPIANTQLYLLNQSLQPVPIGVVGEIYIGGLGLARGYLNHPELTAEKFIPYPGNDKPGERLYKTGDLGRFRPSGVLEFLGRIDDQVKLRGFRIELGEIEAVLRQHPGVRETVVVVREDVASDRRLVAYVVPQEATLTNTDLREFLQPRLPDYMLPSAFVMLNSLPLTSNGKVDRQALPAPDQHRPKLAAVYQEPQTELERTITNVWQAVLHLDQAGIHDNFFDLGGYSLLMVQVHQQLRQMLHQEISLVELFEYPTIYSLAKKLSQNQKEESNTPQLDERVKQRKAALKRQQQMRQRGKQDE